MGIGPFAKAGIVPIAYARVDFAGTSPYSNSGLVTEKLATGVYKITLPSGLSMDENNSYLQVQCWHYQLMSSVQRPASNYFLVQFADKDGAAADCDFTVMLFEPVIPQ